MPQFLDRATRTVVEQYFNEDLPGEVWDATREDTAEKAKIALVRLLDACAEAEKNTPRGRSPMVTVHYIRKQITEALGE